jgi:hypothetical protein
VLQVEAGVQRKSLYVEDGRAVYCSSGNPKEYLGQHLLARTALTEADIERAFAAQRASGRKLGEILVEGGLISTAQLDAVLRHKIEDSMYELFTWTTGRFEFEAGVVPSAEMPVRLSIGWQDLVMEGARRSDEAERIRSVIPGPHVRFQARPKEWPPGFPSNPGDTKLIALIQEGLSVAEICPRFHSSDLDILTRLKAMVESGIIALDPVSIEDSRPLTRDEILRAATEFMQRGNLVEAWELLREAAAAYFDDNAIVAGMRSCELRLRKHFATTMSDFNAVPRLRLSLDQLAGHPLSSKQAYLVSRINGTWSVRSIMQICPFDETEVMCLIDSLVRQGLVEMKAPVEH